MKKERYSDGIRNFAWELLIKYGFSCLPLDIFKLAGYIDVLLVPYTRLAELTDKNVSFIENKYSVAAFYRKSPPERIYYNDTLENIGFQRFSIMHEMSHLLLMHLVDDKEREKEAKMLAARLLEPLIILDRCGVSSAPELAELCGVSKQASEIRFARLEEKRRQGTIGMSRLERTVGDQFVGFIVEYRKNKNR